MAGVATAAVPAALAQPAVAEVWVFAAGSLRAALTEAAKTCEAQAPGVRLRFTFGASGLLDPAIKLGTSTPKADPSGDYAWQLFERIEQAGAPGAFAALSAKALQLTGGPQSPPPPAGRNVYGQLVAQGAADIFITYCTNAVLAQREEPSLRVVNVPDDINVSAGYGISVMSPPSAAGQGFVDFVLAPAGQAVLARHGFSAR
jgi:ABC-type molybdate transport system substrate-binding protein